MVASYQIHNVLKLYTDRIRKRHCRSELAGDSSAVCQTWLPDEVRRDYLVDRLAADIMSRIQRKGPLEGPAKVTPEPEPELESSGSGLDFVYNIIGPDRCKKTVRLSIHDSDFLLRRIEELAAKGRASTTTSTAGGFSVSGHRPHRPRPTGG